MLLIIDNYDSFTFNLVDYFHRLGQECKVYRNDAFELEEIRQQEWDGVVLSPGPNRPEQTKHLFALIECFHQSVPLLGVCLGHQGIGEFFGAKLKLAQEPMHGRTSLVHHQDKKLFKNIPSPFEAMRYHSLVLHQMENSPLKVTAKTKDGVIMALEHPNFPVWGVQFHPESILSAQGLEILRNWLHLINEFNALKAKSSS